MIVIYFYCSHSSRCEVVSHCGFGLHFLTMDNDVESLFLYLSYLFIFFGVMYVQVLFHF